MNIHQMRFEMALEHFLFAAEQLCILFTVTPDLVCPWTASCAALSYSHISALGQPWNPDLLLNLLQDFDVFNLLSPYIYVSPADGDENGNTPAKSGKKICTDPQPILMNYFLVVSHITMLYELLPHELVA